MTQVKKELTTTKSFSYSKGTVNLSFSLKIDDAEQLKTFKQCLLEALADIDKELKK